MAMLSNRNVANRKKISKPGPLVPVCGRGAMRITGETPTAWCPKARAGAKPQARGEAWGDGESVKGHPVCVHAGLMAKLNQRHRQAACATTKSPETPVVMDSFTRT